MRFSAHTKRLFVAMAGAAILGQSIGVAAEPSFKYRVPVGASGVPYDPATGEISALGASTASVVAGSDTKVAVEARVQDQGRRPAARGQTILWSATDGAFEQPSTNTSSGGVATSRYSPPNAVGIYTLTAALASNGAARNVSVQVVANPDAAVIASLTSEESAIFVGGGATKLTARVRDSFGNALGSGVPVTWATSAGTLSATTSNTNESGEATTTLNASDVVGASASVTAKGVSSDAGRIVTVSFKAYGSCAALLAARPGASSGTYPLEIGGQVLQTYCDMTTDGGGWTLVGNQVPSAVGWANTTANINQAAFGNLNATWRYGNTPIQAIAHNTAWRLTADTGTLAFSERTFFRPSCVISWVDTYSALGLSNSMPQDCQMGFTSTAFNTLVSAVAVNNASLGIGMNNSGKYCSARFASSPTLTVNAAYSCDQVNTSRMQLWVK